LKVLKNQNLSLNSLKTDCEVQCRWGARWTFFKRPKHKYPVHCQGTRAKKLNSVLFCLRDWRPSPCRPDLLIRQRSLMMYIFVLFTDSCMLTWPILKNVLKFEDFWCF